MLILNDLDPFEPFACIYAAFKMIMLKIHSLIKHSSDQVNIHSCAALIYTAWHPCVYSDYMSEYMQQLATG